MIQSQQKIVRSFEDLDVYQKAYHAALEVHKLSLGFPKIEQTALADQMRRASKSICANIAEGFAKQRHSSPEFERYLSIAIASSDEMQVWLSFCKDLKYLPSDRALHFRQTYGDVARMLVGLRAKWM